MKVASALLALLCLATVSAKDKEPDPPAKDRIVVLEPFVVKGKPIICFAIDLRLYMDPDTKKVDRMFITRVREGTDADRAGLEPGDEVVKLDGIGVQEYDARVAPDSPLGRLLLNRTPGEPLKFEIITHRTEKITLHAQRILADPSN